MHYNRRQLIALGLSRRQAEELASPVFQSMEQSYHPASVVPQGLLQQLQILREANYLLAVISNRDKPFQQEMESLGLSPYMAFSLAGGEVNAWKPEPELFLHACRRAEVSPEHAVYVGDNYFADVIGARAAGLRPILYDPRGIFPEAGCPMLTSFDQLPSVVDNL